MSKSQRVIAALVNRHDMNADLARALVADAMGNGMFAKMDEETSAYTIWVCYSNYERVMDMCAYSFHRGQALMEVDNAVE